MAEMLREDDTTRGSAPVSGSIIAVNPEAGTSEGVCTFEGLKPERRTRETRMTSLPDEISTFRQRSTGTDMLRLRIIKTSRSARVAHGDNFSASAALSQEPSRTLFIAKHHTPLS